MVISKYFHENRLIIFILVLALGLRLIYCLLVFSPLLEKKGEELGWVIDGKLAVDPYDAIARNLLKGKGYVDDSNRINFERLPLYSYFLVVIYKLLGTELWKLQIVQSVIDTISCLLIYVLSLKLFRDKAAALLAAFLYAVYFKMIALVARPFNETLYILLLLIFLNFFLNSFKRATFSFFSGLLLGMLTLIKPVTLLFPIVVGGLYYFKLKREFFFKLLFFLAGFVILIVPMFVRNYVLERKIFFSSGGGKMFYMGAVFDYSKNFRNREQKLIKEIGRKFSFPYSIEDDNLLRKKAITIIRRDPIGYIKRMIPRIYLFWAYPDYSTGMMAAKTIVILIFNLALIIFAVIGFYYTGKQGIFYAPFLSIILYFYCVYVITYAYSRYSLPLYPILFIFSSYGVISLLNRSILSGRIGINFSKIYK